MLFNSYLDIYELSNKLNNMIKEVEGESKPDTSTKSAKTNKTGKTIDKKPESKSTEPKDEVVEKPLNKILDNLKSDFDSKVFNLKKNEFEKKIPEKLNKLEFDLDPTNKQEKTSKTYILFIKTLSISYDSIYK